MISDNLKCIIDHTRSRLNELHPLVFGVDVPKEHHAMSYFGWHKRLNELNFGRDYSKHPRNPFIK